MTCDGFWACVHEYQTLIAGGFAVVGGLSAVAAVLVRNSFERKVQAEQDLERRAALAASLEGEQIMTMALCTALSAVFEDLTKSLAVEAVSSEAKQVVRNGQSQAQSYMDQIRFPVLDASLDRVGELGPDAAHGLLLNTGRIRMRLAEGVPRDEETSRGYAKQMAVAATESHLMARVLRYIRQELSSGKARPSVYGIVDWAEVAPNTEFIKVFVKPTDLTKPFAKFLRSSPTTS